MVGHRTRRSCHQCTNGLTWPPWLHSWQLGLLPALRTRRKRICVLRPGRSRPRFRSAWKKVTDLAFAVKSENTRLDPKSESTSINRSILWIEWSEAVLEINLTYSKMTHKASSSLARRPGKQETKSLRSEVTAEGWVIVVRDLEFKNEQELERAWARRFKRAQKQLQLSPNEIWGQPFHSWKAKAQARR